MLIRELFQSDVTRDIAPVVYFHEQAPDKLAAEVAEYIITGGWPESHPNHRRVPSGIHEQYVQLLRALAAELDRPGGPDLPNVWISGFYGSGKSSFAKLLGLALDGGALPDGRSLAEAWLARDTSPKAAELRAAWHALRQKVEPIAVVFDIGGVARDNEQVHAAALRQLQRRLGYSTEPLVADFELRLERDGQWPRFLEAAQATLGQPWDQVKDRALVEEDFSLVLSVLYPERYTDPMSWFISRGGTHNRADAPEDAVTAIRDMLGFRAPRATVFLVIDEVSQYVLSYRDRIDRLRAFATALGTTLRGRAWLLALGQQKLDEDADAAFLMWARDRFPPKLRVHLAPTNIRDVIHKRLLQKRPEAEVLLHQQFERHRPELKLYAYGCESVSPEEFVEVYPMLPGQIDLILRITSALRSRSSRAQGDDQAIRGLLQLLGELFRSQKLAEQPVGALVTLDRVYEVQHTALDADAQATMARLLAQCKDDADGLRVRVAKAVALLELIQDQEATDAALVAKCLYDRLDRGNQLPAITEALEDLRRRNLLGYTEKQGYKLQSSAGEEWERERRDLLVGSEAIGAMVQDALKLLLDLERPKLQGREFPWKVLYSDGRQVDELGLVNPRDDAALCVDLRFLTREEATDSTWVRRSADAPLSERLLWLCGDTEDLRSKALELGRSRGMVRKYQPRRESLNTARKHLLLQEEQRSEDLAGALKQAVAASWMGGRFYFRGQSLSPRDHGAAFASALLAAAHRLLPDLFPHFVALQIQPAELMQLLATELAGVSPKFMEDQLGILALDAARYVPACGGVVPRRVLEQLERSGGQNGAALLAHFGGPPYGYAASLVKACVAGLLRGGRLRIVPDDGNEIGAYIDAGARELFESDRSFKRATLFPAGEDQIGAATRNRICKFLEGQRGQHLEREDAAIADAVTQLFPQLAQRLRAVQGQLNQLPGRPEGPPALTRLHDALEACLREVRQTSQLLRRLKQHLDPLRDGVEQLNLHHAELSTAAVQAVNTAHGIATHQLAQLVEVGIDDAGLHQAGERIRQQLTSPRPWRDIGAIDDALAQVRSAYSAERRQLLQWQEQQAEAARARVKANPRFSILSADHAHTVLRPLAEALTATTDDAIAPPLAALKDSFLLTLQRAEAVAYERLDEYDSRGDGKRPLIAKLDLKLKNREIGSEAELDALIEDIRQRLLEQLRAGSRIRLV